MLDPAIASLPFLTREMLALPLGTVFTLRIKSQSRNNGDLLISGLTKSGTFSYIHTTVSTGVVTTTLHNLADIPISVSVSDNDLFRVQGNCYVVVSLLANGVLLQELTSGFVMAIRALSWPQQTGSYPLLERGNITNISGANPAAGSEFSITVPVGRTWRVLNVVATLVTDGNAANRRVHINFGSTYKAICDIDQTATTTIQYFAQIMGVIPDTTDNSKTIISIPEEIYINEADTINSVTTNFQVGDNWGTPFVEVEEFFTQPL